MYSCPKLLKQLAATIYTYARSSGYTDNISELIEETPVIKVRETTNKTEYT